MIITRRSKISNEINSMNLNVTQDQLNNWMNGTLIQEAFPQLNEDEREFIMTGILPEEWNELFGDSDE